MTTSTAAPPSGRTGRILLGLSALVPLPGLIAAPHDTMLPIYSLFVAAVFLRQRLERAAARVRLPRELRFAGLILLCGLLTETLAWLGSYLAADPEPALLHPQLAYDLLLSPVVYGGWALGWLLLMRRWRFTLAEVVILQGLYGILLEQQGAVLRQGWEAMPAGILLWIYVFAVYGSAIGLAYVMFEGSYARDGRPRGWIRLPVAFLVLLLMTVVSSFAWGMTLQVLGVHVPDPRPIVEAPFW